uniref:hypothetical protein n=1 Tax=Halorhabdus amylolytica TaxID=2559573 RepID=UPI0020BF1A32|nr:hypothetical protein [Halorhabdus amylolytica]
MREQLTKYQAEFGIDSPEELAVNQTNQALAKSGSPQDKIDPETIREWKTLRRYLAFANAVFSIGSAKQYLTVTVARLTIAPLPEQCGILQTKRKPIRGYGSAGAADDS